MISARDSPAGGRASCRLELGCEAPPVAQAGQRIGVGGDEELVVTRAEGEQRKADEDEAGQEGGDRAGAETAHQRGRGSAGADHDRPLVGVSRSSAHAPIRRATPIDVRPALGGRLLGDARPAPVGCDSDGAPIRCGRRPSMTTRPASIEQADVVVALHVCGFASEALDGHLEVDDGPARSVAGGERGRGARGIG